MKKVLFTAVAALAMVAMVACNGKKAQEEPVANDTAAVEQCEHKCAHEGDTAAMCCKAEDAAMDTTKACCKEGKGECKKAEGQQCCKEKKAE